MTRELLWCAAAFSAGFAGAAQAAAPVGVISGGANALVLRNGHLLPAAANMSLYPGDRVVTRAGGSAQVAISGKCQVAVGASAMVPVSAEACANGASSFDGGRAGYEGRSSAITPEAGAIGLIGLGTVGYGISRAVDPDGGSNDDDDNGGSPASP